MAVQNGRAVEAEPPEEEDAGHLVSFLTGYGHRQHGDEDDLDHSGSDSDQHSSQHEPDVDDDEDPDNDEEATPTKRAKTGLVGSSSRNTTPKSSPTKARKTPTPRKKATPKPTPQPDENEFGIIRPSKADEYFTLASRSSKTSGASYSSLAKPLSQAAYDKWTRGARSKGKAKADVDGLIDDLALRFPQWELELDEGFNLLFHGFGSKRRLLNRFVADRLKHRGHCVVSNGHFPSMAIRSFLTQIEDSLSIPSDIPVPPSATSPLDKLVHRIYAYFLPSDAGVKHPVAKAELYLLLHNIDAPALRTPRALGSLSLLASSPRIHLLASFDHLNTPLLFSTSTSNAPPHHYLPKSWAGTPQASRGFNWLYHAATTYDDYDLELSYQRMSATSSFATSAGGISEEGALQILQSVPPMALRLIKLLMTRQLTSLPPDPSQHNVHPANVIAPAFATDNDILQTLAREKFIAREKERYNALIGEFRDHGLVVEAGQDAEGRSGRWVWIPLGKGAVERVLQTMSEVEV